MRDLIDMRSPVRLARDVRFRYIIFANGNGDS